MPTLKRDTAALGRVKSKLASIVSELQDVDSFKAEQLTDWLLDEAKYYNKHFHKEKFRSLPNPKATKGDIVLVQFGINIGDEFSDDSTKGHFGLIWGQQGFLFIVIPLSKQWRNDDWTIDLGKIQGLPDNNSYAKLDNIRAISIRRIKRINSETTGKVTIEDPSIIQKIEDAIKAKFLSQSSTSISTANECIKT